MVMFSQLGHVSDGTARELARGIAEEVARLMKEKGISRAQLAELAGVSQPAIGQLFEASPDLTLRWIARLAVALGTAPVLSMGVPLATAAACSGCGAVYLPPRRPQAGLRHYCEECWRTKVPVRDAARDYRERERRKGQGAS